MLPQADLGGASALLFRFRSLLFTFWPPGPDPGPDARAAVQERSAAGITIPASTARGLDMSEASHAWWDGDPSSSHESVTLYWMGVPSVNALPERMTPGSETMGP